MDPQKFKEQGNEHFKNEDYEEAITCYTKALKFSDRSKNDKDCAIYLKNRSACKLKVEDYEGERRRVREREREREAEREREGGRGKGRERERQRERDRERVDKIMRQNETIA